jgi:cell division protein FtsB
MSGHPTNEPPMSFSEQLRDFLRRNFNWFLATGLALLLLQDVFGTHGVLAMRRSQKEAGEVRKEIDQINEENLRLQERVKSLKTDPEAIEHIAREEMGLARPGEYIFKIPPKPGEATPSSSQPLGPPKKP